MTATSGSYMVKALPWFDIKPGSRRERMIKMMADERKKIMKEIEEKKVARGGQHEYFTRSKMTEIKKESEAITHSASNENLNSTKSNIIKQEDSE